MPLAPLLVALAGPIARQILLSLGIGVVTFIGLDAAASNLIGQAAASANGMTPKVASVFGLAGGYRAMSIIAGAVTFRVSMMALKRFRLL